MAMEKGLYAAPVGIDEAAEQGTPLEIEIEDPESVTINMDGTEIRIGKEEETEEEFSDNLAEYISENQL